MIYDPEIHSKVKPYLDYLDFISGGSFIVMTSGYRPGSKGYHGKTADGEAIDYSSDIAPNLIIRFYHLLRYFKPENISAALSVHNNHIHIWREKAYQKFEIEDKNRKGEYVIRPVEKEDFGKVYTIYGTPYIQPSSIIDYIVYPVYRALK